MIFIVSVTEIVVNLVEKTFDNQCMNNFEKILTPAILKAVSQKHSSSDRRKSSESLPDNKSQDHYKHGHCRHITTVTHRDKNKISTALSRGNKMESDKSSCTRSCCNRRSTSNQLSKLPNSFQWVFNHDSAGQCMLPDGSVLRRVLLGEQVSALWRWCDSSLGQNVKRTPTPTQVADVWRIRPDNYPVLLSRLDMACGSRWIHESAATCVFHFSRNPASAALSARTCFTRSRQFQKERQLTSYFQVVKYLLNPYPTEKYNRWDRCRR